MFDLNSDLSPIEIAWIMLKSQVCAGKSTNLEEAQQWIATKLEGSNI